MPRVSGLKTLASLLTMATVAYAVRNRQAHGSLMKMPYDFRVPTPQKLRGQWWNPEDQRIVTPSAFGVGWGLNLYQVAKKLGLRKEEQAETASDSSTNSDEF